MYTSTKAMLVLVSALSLVNLAQAQSGDRVERVNRARKGLSQSAGSKKKIETKQVSSNQANANGNAGNRSNKSIPHIDLAVTSVRQNNNSLRIRVMNQGRSSAPSTKLRVQVRNYNTGRVVLDRTLPVKSLTPNQSVNMLMRTGTLNEVNVYATIDSEYRVIEPNERNNVGTLQIGNQTEYAVDLKISEIRFDRAKKEVWVAVRNVGPVPLNRSASVSLRSYFGPGNRVESHIRRVRQINSGQKIFTRFSVEQMKVGMQFEAIVDPSNALPETSERNNKLTKTFNG
mgnify:CR=1 FL=1